MWMLIAIFWRAALEFQAPGVVQKCSSRKAAAIFVRSVASVREHGKMARTLLAAFFNSAIS